MRIPTFFLVLLAIFSCSSKHGEVEDIQISGSVRNTNNGYIYLERLTREGYEKIDSTRLDDNNQFALAAPKGEMDIYRINFFGRQQVNLVVGDDDLKIETDGNRPTGFFSGTGSEGIEVISFVNQLAAKRHLKNDLISQKMRTAAANRDSVKFSFWNDSLSIIDKQFDKVVKDIIRQEEGSLTGLLLIEENFDIEPNLEFYTEQMPVFKERLGDSWYFDKLNNEYRRIKKLALGAKAPDFSLPDPEGDPIKMSSYHGKYLYLDFWASWCQPCRVENPKLVKVYEKYKGPNFEIIGISFDKSRENWLKAIEKDNLEWIHVSDLKYMDSEMIDLYNIVNVPMSFLLDPEGKIIAKNIHAHDLDLILEGKLSIAE